MSDTSLFAFYDQLLAKVRALPECQEPVVVYDGIPGPNQPPLYVCIGGTAAPDVQDIERWAELGAHAKWEDYGIQCYIRAWSGGDDDQGSPTGDAQATARNNAGTVFKAIESALRADINFQTSNGGTPLVLWCEVTDIRLKQTPVTAADDGSKGRAVEIAFTVQVKNRF